jgi:regulatory protein
VDDIHKIRETIIRLLSRREHSRFELYTKLKRYTFDTNLLDAVIQELTEKGLQSDDRFTENYVLSRINRGYGPIRIKLELHDRGISDELVEKYVHHDDEMWYQIAKKVQHKRFGRHPNDTKERFKQMNFLRYRGFTFEQLHEVFKR